MNQQTLWNIHSFNGGISSYLRKALVVCLMLLPISVQAQLLNPLSLETYIKSLDAVIPFAENLKKGPHQKDLFGAMQYQAGQPFEPHMQGVQFLQQTIKPEYKTLNKLVSDTGFASASSWARVGDRVALTYAALKIERDNPEFLTMAKQLRGMTDEMKAMLPPVLLQQLKNAEWGISLLSAVDESDKKLLSPYYNQLSPLYQKLSQPAAK